MTLTEGQQAQYLAQLIDAIPQYTFFQIGLMRQLLELTQAVAEYEQASKPGSFSSIPIDAHGFPHLQHMMGGVQFALSQHEAVGKQRATTVGTLFDVLAQADSGQIKSAAASLQARGRAEAQLTNKIATLTEKQRAYLAGISGTRKSGETMPLVYDPQYPGILLARNWDTPLNTPGQQVDSKKGRKYLSAPQNTQVGLKYLPPLSLGQGSEEYQFRHMSNGALLVLAAETLPHQFLHLFNARVQLANFTLQEETQDTYTRVSVLNKPSDQRGLEERDRLPLFELLSQLQPELFERVTLVDLRDVSEDEQKLFYSALAQLNALCSQIKGKFDEYMAQKISDALLINFLETTVPTAIDAAFNPLTTNRLRMELQLGYAAVLKRLKIERGLEKGAMVVVDTSKRTAAVSTQQPQKPKKNRFQWLTG